MSSSWFSMKKITREAVDANVTKLSAQFNRIPKKELQNYVEDFVKFCERVNWYFKYGHYFDESYLRVQVGMFLHWRHLRKETFGELLLFCELRTAYVDMNVQIDILRDGCHLGYFEECADKKKKKQRLVY